MKPLALVPFLPLLAACATIDPPASDAEQRGAAGSACRSSNYNQFAGRPASADLGGEIMRASGAGTLQWIPHGTMVTMEYRADRVRVWLNEQNRVARVNCG